MTRIDWKRVWKEMDKWASRFPVLDKPDFKEFQKKLKSLVEAQLREEEQKIMKALSLKSTPLTYEGMQQVIQKMDRLRRRKDGGA